MLTVQTNGDEGGDDGDGRERACTVKEVASVGEASLDAEHRACEAALSAFAAAPSVATLKTVRHQIATHFANEQQLLDEYLYSDLKEEGFSAAAGMRKSHYADHSRIIENIDSQLSVAGRDGKEPAPEFVKWCLSAWEEHEAYDQGYAESLADAMAAP